MIDIISEVFFRGVVLLIMFFAAFIIDAWLTSGWRNTEGSVNWFRFPFGLVAIFGSGAVMTFWDSLFW